MTAPFPAERWFWFDPPFHRNRSVLLHRQPDDLWRIDFQLGWDADPDVEKQPERVLPRIRALLGADVPFELVWLSVYTFACERMASFRPSAGYGRVLFAGDAAHRVSPFGARGANSGVQDADNLGWKLAAVARGAAPVDLIDSYAAEREAAADENIAHSTRATDFITPKSPVSRVFRDAVLQLAQEHPFARRLVNSGRLSTPTVLSRSPLTTVDPPGDVFAPTAGETIVELGAPALDAPVLVDGVAGWLLDQFVGNATVLIYVGDDAVPRDPADDRGDLGQLLAWRRTHMSNAYPLNFPIDVVVVRPATTAPAEPAAAPVVFDAEERVRFVIDHVRLVARRYDAQVGSIYLLRPDQHLSARWRRFDASRLDAALTTMHGQSLSIGAERRQPLRAAICH